MNAPAPLYVRLPWRKAPLSLNDRSHWGTKAETVRVVRAATRTSVAAHLGAAGVTRARSWPRIVVQLGYTPADRRARDTDNLAATQKAVCDAIAKMFDIDDTPRWMAKPEPIITAPSTDPHLWVELSPAPAYVEEPAR